VSVADKATGERETAYGRAFVEARLGLEEEGMTRTIGVAFAFDLGAPQVQVYHGSVVSACTNLTIFATGGVVTLNYLQHASRVAGALDIAAEAIDDDFKALVAKAQELKATTYDAGDVRKKIGEMVLKSQQKGTQFDPSLVMNAAGLLVQPTSRYALAPDGSTSAWNLYNALTQGITDRSYPHVRAPKTLAASEFFGAVALN
jgi:hypothetical protein